MLKSALPQKKPHPCAWIVLALIIFQQGRGQIDQLFGGSNLVRYRGGLSYEGASALGEMTDISSLYPGTGSLFGNPAGTLNVPRHRFQVDISMPGLGVTTSTRKSPALKELVTEGMDGFLESEENDIRPENRTDPELSTDIAHSAGLEGLGIIYKFPQLKWPMAVTGAFERLADFQLDVEINDFNIGLAMPMDDSDPASDSIKARFNLQSGLGFHLGLNRRGIGIAMEIPQAHLKWGVAIHQYMAVFDFNAVGEANGFISRNEQESYFNLESAPYPDDLKIDYRGFGKGSTPGFAFGTNLTFLKYFGFDFVFNYKGTVDLGYLKGEHYILNAIDSDKNENGNTDQESDKTEEDEAEEELFEVSKLNLTKMTLTKKVTNDIQNIRLELPSRIGASLSFKLKRIKFNIDFAWYYREMKLRYEHKNTKVAFDTSFNDIIKTAQGEDSLEIRETQGVLGSGLNTKIAAGINLWGFFLNGGVYLGNPIFFENSREVDIGILPIFNLGYAYQFRKNYAVEVSLVSLPLKILRTTLQYNF